MSDLEQVGNLARPDAMVGGLRRDGHRRRWLGRATRRIGRGCRRWLWAAQRRAVDADGNAMMLQAIEQRIDQRLLVEQVIPVRQIEVGGDDRRDAVVALIHQTEESVGLFGLERQVAELVDLCCARHKSTWTKPQGRQYLAPPSLSGLYSY